MNENFEIVRYAQPHKNASDKNIVDILHINFSKQYQERQSMILKFKFWNIYVDNQQFL